MGAPSKDSRNTAILQYVEQHPGVCITQLTEAFTELTVDQIKNSLQFHKRRGLLVNVTLGNRRDKSSLRWFTPAGVPKQLQHLVPMPTFADDEPYTEAKWVYPIRARALGLTRAA